MFLLLLIPYSRPPPPPHAFGDMHFLLLLTYTKHAHTSAYNTAHAHTAFTKQTKTATSLFRRQIYLLCVCGSLF